MTGTAYRSCDGSTVLYLMPYEDAGQPVLFRQDSDSFHTTRQTVDRDKAARVARDGREVELYETPAWCDKQRDILPQVNE